MINRVLITSLVHWILNLQLGFRHQKKKGITKISRINTQERAHHNLKLTTISTLRWMELYNHTRLHLARTQAGGRKVSYIHIARNNFQQRGLFKPAQYLRNNLDHLPLIRLRIQATCHILPNLYLANDHTSPMTPKFAPLASPSTLWVINSRWHYPLLLPIFTLLPTCHPKSYPYPPQRWPLLLFLLHWAPTNCGHAIRLYDP